MSPRDHATCNMCSNRPHATQRPRATCVAADRTPGGTQRQSPDDDTTTFVGYLLSKSLSALNINPHKLNDEVQLPTSDAWQYGTPCICCSNRSISPGRRAHSSKPDAAACGGKWDERTNRETDRRTEPDSCIDPAPHTMRAVPMIGNVS